MIDGFQPFIELMVFKSYQWEAKSNFLEMTDRC